MSYQGRCRCGTVTFTVAADLPQTAVACPCPRCRQMDILLTFVPDACFTLLSGTNDIGQHQVHRHPNRHFSCSLCGTAVFIVDARPDGSVLRGINLRCVPIADPGAMSVRWVDGAHH